MDFCKEHLLPGGKVHVPHSMVNADIYGEITESTKTGIHVVYYKGQSAEQKAFYSFAYLKHRYGSPTLRLTAPAKEKDKEKELDDEVPFNL